ncbi:MAG TPA: hypothetical protein VG167_04225, partial [Verrucomicrobiae bacterium]|nr:hypothetical protein [Verrucomicrobiae bacterium]
MRLTNFTFDSSVEIGTDGRHRYLDMHNIYAWQGVFYFSDQRRVRMSWLLPPVSSFGPHAKYVQDLPGGFVLEFRGVSRFAATPHDPELPYTEDTCLDGATFTPEGEHSDSGTGRKVFRVDVGYITFTFRSGFCITIWAEEAELILDRMPNTY